MPFSGKVEIFIKGIFVSSNMNFQRIVINRIYFGSSDLIDYF